jgi:hypothetical protein
MNPGSDEQIAALATPVMVNGGVMSLAARQPSASRMGRQHAGPGRAWVARRLPGPDASYGYRSCVRRMLEQQHFARTAASYGQVSGPARGSGRLCTAPGMAETHSGLPAPWYITTIRTARLPAPPPPRQHDDRYLTDARSLATAISLAPAFTAHPSVVEPPPLKIWRCRLGATYRRITLG